MPVIINYKKCDMNPGCPCIKICPKKAWIYDIVEKKPVIDISKCNNCGLCIKECPGRAALFVSDSKGIQKVTEDIEKDSRKEQEVFEARYGVYPLKEKLTINEKSFEKEVLEAEGLVLVELWSERFASRCRINAPLYIEIIPKETNIKIVQIDVDSNQKIAQKYDAFAIPSLLLFSKGKLIEYIASCTSVADKEIIRNRITNALNKI